MLRGEASRLQMQYYDSGLEYTTRAWHDAMSRAGTNPIRSRVPIAKTLRQLALKQSQ